MEKFKEEYLYRLAEVAFYILLFIGSFVLAFVAVLGPLFLAFAPMQYVSPWWGLVSIPGTIALVALGIVLFKRWRS